LPENGNLKSNAMKRNLKRKIYTGLLKKMPRHRRTVEDFYFVYFCISAIFWLLLISPILDYVGLSRPAWSSLACATVLACLLFLWNLDFSRVWLQIIFQFNILWVILYNAYYTGGITSPLMVWIAIVPILPLFTISRRGGYISLFISFMCVVGVYVFQMIGMIPFSPNVTEQDLSLNALMNGLLCLTLLMLVVTYDSIHAKHIRIIERKNAALKNLSTSLQMVDKHKNKFLATVSHEMRTPLNAMMGYLGLLRTSDNLPSNLSNFVDGAQSASSHLLTVINDLLDFSQIQKGKLSLTLQEIDLHQVLKCTHKTLEPKAESHDLNYELIIDTNVPQWVKTDPHRLSQIMLNLLGNALKFTNEGRVITHVTYESNPHILENGFLILQVQDTGVGIPRSFFKDIFEPFSQLPVQFHNENSLRGNGLGLSITKTLVTSMGGQISLDSQEGVGSVFEVRLPIHIVSAPSDSQPEKINMKNLDHIYLLLVDDHATNRLVATATIKQDIPNARIDQARNGTEAIAKMKANKYDLVLMDMIMPDYSGIEVTRIIRSECVSPLSDVKIVALTANVEDALAQECAEVNINEILRKPFERPMLIRTIIKHAVS
jgi:signal transduction histidine kinase/CheY-like chemotaxis protein